MGTVGTRSSDARSTCGARDSASAEQSRDGRCPLFDAESVVYRRQVKFDGPFGDAQIRGDLLVVETGAEARGDSRLPGGQSEAGQVARVEAVRALDDKRHDGDSAPAEIRDVEAGRFASEQGRMDSFGGSVALEREDSRTICMQDPAVGRDQICSPPELREHSFDNCLRLSSGGTPQ
jgi:hypothetical protein